MAKQGVRAIDNRGRPIEIIERWTDRETERERKKGHKDRLRLDPVRLVLAPPVATGQRAAAFERGAREVEK